MLLSFSAVGFGADVKTGALMVDVLLEDLSVRCAVGRRFKWLGIWTDGDSGAGPSNGEGDGMRLLDSSSSGAGVTLAALGEADGVSSLVLAWPSCLEGEAGMLKLLLGLASGLDGVSEVWLI